MIDNSDERAAYKNLMASDQSNGIANRHDAQGNKVESRGSRRSVVFSKIKNPGQQWPSSGGNTLSNGQVTQSKHQIKLNSNEKQQMGGVVSAANVANG